MTDDLGNIDKVIALLELTGAKTLDEALEIVAADTLATRGYELTHHRDRANDFRIKEPGGTFVAIAEDSGTTRSALTLDEVLGFVESLPDDPDAPWTDPIDGDYAHRHDGRWVILVSEPPVVGEDARVVLRWRCPTCQETLARESPE